MRRRTTTTVRVRRQLGDAKIKPTTTMRCAEGHEFGLDKDRCASFYGRIPESVPCPDPSCRCRVRVAS